MTSTNTGPKAGDKAPDFSALDDKGERVSLADFKGRNVVLYFYPVT
jgi:peroxiredoxin Q/BCP